MHIKCFCGRVPWLYQYWPFLWFYVQELPKAQPAVVLVLKRLRRRGNGLKSHPTDSEKPGIEPATPGLQDIGLSPTPRRLLLRLIVCHFIISNHTACKIFHMAHVGICLILCIQCVLCMAYPFAMKCNLCRISTFWLVFVDEQAGLTFTLSQTKHA